MVLIFPWLNSPFSCVFHRSPQGMETWWPKAFWCVGRWDLAVLMPLVTNHAFPSGIAALHLGNQGWWGLPIEGVCARTWLCQSCPYLKIQSCPSGSTDLKAAKFGVCSYVVLWLYLYLISELCRLWVCVWGHFHLQTFLPTKWAGKLLHCNRSWVSKVVAGLSFEPFPSPPLPPNIVRLQVKLWNVECLHCFQWLRG